MRNNKQLATNLIANIISFGVSFGISFFLSPYIISNVGKEAHGFVSLANDFVNYIALFTIALNSMASRFITIKIHKNDWKMHLIILIHYLLEIFLYQYY